MQYELIEATGMIVTSPKLKKITPTTGFYRNKECSMLTFKFLIQSCKNSGSAIFVRLFHGQADKAAKLLFSGMKIWVSGSAYQKEYLDKQGIKRTARILNAEKIWLDVLQDGLNSMSFIYPEKIFD